MTLQTADFHRLLYEKLVKSAIDQHGESLESRALAVECAAKFAVPFFPGLLSDPRLESILCDIGAQIDAGPSESPAAPARRRVVHVVSEFYPVGGHTRVVRNWIQQDTNTESFVVVTRETSWMPAWQEYGISCRVHKLQGQSRVERAVQLREEVRRIQPDLIVLHHAPDDVVPVVAFALPGGAPVVLYNHADFLFGLGASIADSYVEYRPESCMVSERFRFARRTHVLWFPLETRTFPDRSTARTRISAGGTHVLVSMARSCKYRPIESCDFVAFFSAYLRQRPGVHLYVVGISDDDVNRFGEYAIPHNLHFVGEIDDPSDYCVAADIFVEPFPMGAGLAAYDVLRHGAAPAFAYCSLDIVGPGTSSTFPASMREALPTTVAEYTSQLDSLIEKTGTSHSKRPASTYLDHIKTCLSPQWERHVEELYAALSGMSHSPQVLPELREFSGPRVHQFARHYSLDSDPLDWFVDRGVDRIVDRRVRDALSASAIEFRRSWTWKIGAAATWPARRIYDLVTYSRSGRRRRSLCQE